MEQLTKKSSFLRFTLGAALILLAFALYQYTAIGDILRSSLFGIGVNRNEAGLYLSYLDGSQVRAGSGVILSTNGITDASGYQYIDVTVATGTGSTSPRTLTGSALGAVVTYDPTEMSIGGASGTGYLVDLAADTREISEFTSVVKGPLTESGAMIFALEKTSGYFVSPRERVARLKVRLLKPRATLSLETVRILDAAAPYDSPTLFLDKDKTRIVELGWAIKNFEYVPLVLANDGSRVETSTFATTGSGQVLRESRFFADGKVYIKDSWQDQVSREFMSLDAHVQAGSTQAYEVVTTVLNAFGIQREMLKKSSGQVIETWTDMSKNQFVFKIVTKNTNGDQVTETREINDQNRVAIRTVLAQSGGLIRDIYTDFTGSRTERTQSSTGTWLNQFDPSNVMIKSSSGSYIGSTFLQKTINFSAGLIVSQVTEEFSLDKKIKKTETIFRDGSKELLTYEYAADGTLKRILATLTSPQGKTSTIEYLYDAYGRNIEKNVLNQTAGSIPGSNTSYKGAVTLMSTDKKLEIKFGSGSLLSIQEPVLKDSVLESLASLPNNYRKGSNSYQLLIAADQSSSLTPFQASISYDPERVQAPKGKRAKEITVGYLSSTGSSWLNLIKSVSDVKDGKVFFTASQSGYYAVLVLFESTDALGGTLPAPSIPTTTSGCKPQVSKFVDIKGHKYESFIEQARSQCIVSGVSDGEYFSPDFSLTRAELAKIIVTSDKDLTAKLASKRLSTFRDVSDSAWYGSYVSLMKQEGIIAGYQDGTFKPERTVNRAEAIKMILAAKDIAISGGSATNYKDVPVNAWFAPYISYIQSHQILGGKIIGSERFFFPDTPITRAEAIKVLLSVQ